MRMPEPDAAVLSKREQIVRDLSRILPGEGIIADSHALKAYESDGLTAYRQPPMIVALPETTAQVAEILRYCHDGGIKVVPRGAGTSLSGGALPLADGVVVGLGKFNRILDVDYANRCVVAQPGVTNLAITDAVAGAGFWTTWPGSISSSWLSTATPKSRRGSASTSWRTACNRPFPR